MTDIIQLLPDSVANQIAAGEVIQRPASVVKELVENAVDAGAKNIQVLIVDAGRTSIQVIDDGCGMSETDARLAFERHATSKIRKAEDLFMLQTMGFRGEALPSIAAVAQVELRTRRPHDDVGTVLSIAGSKVVSQEVCSCPVGSNFKVDNIFYNVPARRKFLKSNTTEMSNITQAFERIALVYPDIAFTLFSNGSELYNLHSASIRQRIADVFGKRYNQSLLPVEVETSVCSIMGYVGKPEAARRKGAHQFFFVNGRFMRHPYFHKAIQNSFERLVAEGMQVPYFIYFKVPAENIDVNIHPTKTEIKFENEQAIWQILAAAVKDAIGMFSEITAIDFDTEGKPDIPVFKPDHDIPSPEVAYLPGYNPFKPTQSSKTSRGEHSVPPHERKTGVSADWKQLYDGLLKQDHAQPSQLSFTHAEKDGLDSSGNVRPDDCAPIHYQYKGRYIMTAVKSGLMLIDQHRAHVRILYEVYLERLNNRQWTSQKMLFPEMVQFSPAEDMAFSAVMQRMTDMGFEFSPLGGGSYAVSAIPAGLEGIQPVDLIRDMVAEASDAEGNDTTDVGTALAMSLARHAAIPYGQVLGNEEMENIVNSLFSCSNVNYTPDGKTILNILRQQEIDRLFSS